MKDYKFTFEVDDNKYTLVFNLNVMESIQKQYEKVLSYSAFGHVFGKLQQK